MIKLSAFADEISDDLDEQIRVLKKTGVGNIELRGVWGKNVMELSDGELKQIAKAAHENGLGFSAIGSPIGKHPIDGDIDTQFELLKRAIDIAHVIDAKYIRIFSFYISEDDDPAQYRWKVLDWLGKLVAEAEKTGVILAHENEKGIYGDTGERNLDLYRSINSNSFVGMFDPANYAELGQKPYQDCWLATKDHIEYFHIKDYSVALGRAVPAGEGDGDIEKILADAYAAGFDNFLTLEPHLSMAEKSYGRTSPELFEKAVDAFRRLLSKISA